MSAALVPLAANVAVVALGWMFVPTRPPPPIHVPPAAPANSGDAIAIVVVIVVIVAIVVAVMMYGIIIAVRAVDAAAQKRASEDRQRAQAQWESLCQQFGCESAGRIFKHEYWQGQTMAELLASRGPPVDIDEKMMTKGRRHVFKYERTGARSFALRITLDHGIVTRWEHK